MKLIGAMAEKKVHEYGLPHAVVKDASWVSRRPQTLAMRKVQCIHAAATVNYGLPVFTRALGRDLAIYII